MKLTIQDAGAPATLAPFSLTRALAAFPLGGTTFGHALARRLEDAIRAAPASPGLELVVHGAFWPSPAEARRLAEAPEGFAVAAPDGTLAAWVRAAGDPRPPAAEAAVPFAAGSRMFRHPWDALFINEELLGALAEDDIRGAVRERVSIDGKLRLGEGSVLLPGVYIEGNVAIGRNCKVGPNCYIRGNTHIGDGCHVGQAVEIKNSILMDKACAGHLTYLGDSIVGEKANLGAGTITSNLRHDGKAQRSPVNGVPVDTGRRKLGAFIGDGCHTGIHTSFYPGRKLWPGVGTLPGEIVSKDKERA